ncbi:S53 family peptidase [Leekyejoonella antrihumi]|uniref:Serine protease n=1 Tax=Leekyejoonella antrihumi TaxID=1660198 RepID=A0A563EAM3_9MICO|nr:S53 family peptidase [Leekyejoonella antrihumi]TWP38844.1 serine protease [Leekyejoonella antrihumi]
MHRSSRFRTALIGGSAVFALACATPGFANAAASPGHNRHAVTVKPAWTTHASAQSAVTGAHHLSFNVVLNMRDAAGAQALAKAVSDPASAEYGHYVTAAQWRHRFAPTSSQIADVVAWLKSQGLTVGTVPANGRFIPVTGSVSAVNQAFQTTMRHYSLRGAAQTAPSTSLTVPESISPLVAGVSGLDSTAMAHPTSNTGTTTSDLKGPSSSPEMMRPLTSTSTSTLPGPPPAFVNAGPCSKYYGQKSAKALPKLVKNPMSYAVCGYQPAQIRGAYGLDTASRLKLNGSGVTVAIVDAYAAPTIYQDASKYARKHDQRNPLLKSKFTQDLPSSYSHVNECGGNGWYGEETLDVEAVHATAPGANIRYVGGASCYDTDLDAAVNRVVDQHSATIITNSYGDAGEPTSITDVAAEHQTAIQAAAEGISLLFSSGDNGDEVADLGYRTVDYEASDPWVTAVGGTSLKVNRYNGYAGEQGWGTGKSTLTNGKWDPKPPAYVYGGGGGTSKLFTQPWYQKGVVPTSISNYFGNGPHRAVPDVAMDADPQTGFLVGETQAFPNGSTRYAEYRIGGTSLASPLFAGVVAVASQGNHRPLGFLNPSLYSLSGTHALRDVNHGKAVTDAVVRVDYVNGVNAKDGTVTSARTLNQTGTIFTRKGYDDVTGVGSPNGLSFLRALQHR